MKKTYLLILMLSIGVLLGTVSDFEIVKKFNEDILHFRQKTKNIQTQIEIDSLSKVLDEMENNYRDYREVITAKVYPKTYLEIFEDARSDLKDGISSYKLRNELDVETHKNQDLSSQILQKNKELARIEADNAGLINTISTLNRRIKKNDKDLRILRRNIARLKENFRERDKLIFEAVDSLFKQFSKDNSSDKQKDLLVNSKSIIENIKNIIDENINLLNSSSLSAEDLDFSIKEHKRFKDLWSLLEKNIINTYYEKEKHDIIKDQIHKKLTDWNEAISECTWRSLQIAVNSYFQTGNILNKNEFIDTIDEILEKENSGNKKDSLWQQEFIEHKWLDYLREHKFLSEIEIQDLSKKMQKKFLVSASELPFKLIVMAIIGLLVVLVILYLILKILRKRKKNERYEE